MRLGLVLVLVLLVAVVATGAWFLRQHGAGRSALPAERAAPLRSDVEMPEVVAGWAAAAPPEVYDPESIYSYIDGHAEVYRAYGMRRCISRRLTGPAGEADLVIDVFELASPEDAFGVFTHDRDGEPAGIGNDSLFRHGWLSFWQGPYFVSIVAEGDTARARAAALEAGRTLAAGLPKGGHPPAIVGELPASNLDPRSVRFLRHPQILNTHVFVSDENVLGLAPDTAGALGTYRRGDSRAYLLIVDYPDAARAQAAEAGFRAHLAGRAEGDAPVAVEGRGFFAVRTSGPRLQCVLAAPTAEFARDLLQAAQSATGGVR